MTSLLIMCLGMAGFFMMFVRQKFDALRQMSHTIIKEQVTNKIMAIGVEMLEPLNM